MAKRRGYLGLDWIISLILLFFTVGIIFAIIERVLRGNILGAILTFVLFPIFWIVDVICLIVYKDIRLLA